MGAVSATVERVTLGGGLLGLVVTPFFGVGVKFLSRFCYRHTLMKPAKRKVVLGRFVLNVHRIRRFYLWLRATLLRHGNSKRERHVLPVPFRAILQRVLPYYVALPGRGRTMTRAGPERVGRHASVSTVTKYVEGIIFVDLQATIHRVPYFLPAMNHKGARHSSASRSRLALRNRVNSNSIRAAVIRRAPRVRKQRNCGLVLCLVVVTIYQRHRPQRRFPKDGAPESANVRLVHLFQFRFAISRTIVVRVIRNQRARNLLVRRARVRYFQPPEAPKW